jgi:D-arabinose 1-dehydrogenase-like Zn-dependent alcohol dehydrogenase
VLKRITLRGSIVGTRRDLDDAIAFAAEGKVKAEMGRAMRRQSRTQERLVVVLTDEADG